MNRDTIEGNWKQLKGKVKTQSGDLAGSALDVIDGKRVELPGGIQAGPGIIISDAVERQIDRPEERTGE